MSDFSFNKNYLYYIYGGGANSVNVISNLLKNGFLVKAVIDINADKINNIEGVSVISPDKFKCESADSSILIILLNNGVTHEIITENFFEKYGIKRILYLPMNSAISEEKKHRLRNAYIDIISGNTDIRSVPVYENNKKSDYRIIDDTGDAWISLWMPVKKCTRLHIL